MKVRVTILPLTKDLRAPSDAAGLDQARADAALEQLWRDRVAANIRRRQAATTEGVSIEHCSSRAA